MGPDSEFEKAALNQPAIGLIATEDNTDAIVRVIVLARNHNHAVFVAYSGQEEPRSVRFARELGAEVIRLDDSSIDSEMHRHILSTVVRSHGFPGLLFHSSPEEYIDYNKCQETFWKQPELTVNAPTQDSSGRISDGVLVAIPAYNEASAVADVVWKARQYADAVLVVDDGSTDDTAAVAEAAGAEVIQHEKNSGYGAALKTAFTEARERGNQHLVTLDGDGQHNPDDIGRLVQVQKDEKAEVVIGSRFVDNAHTEIPPYRRLGLRVVNFLTNLSLGVVRSESRVRDTQSGFRAYDETAIETLSKDPNLGDNMSISTDILYHAQQRNYRIEEVGTVIDYDVDDGSNHNPLAHGYILVMNLLTTIEHTRPLMALALPGFILTLIGFGFGYWGILHYMNANQFPVNLVAVSAFFILIGMLICLSGIILHSLNTYFSNVPYVTETTAPSRPK